MSVIIFKGLDWKWQKRQMVSTKKKKNYKNVWLLSSTEKRSGSRFFHSTPGHPLLHWECRNFRRLNCKGFLTTLWTVSAWRQKNLLLTQTWHDYYKVRKCQAVSLIDHIINESLNLIYSEWMKSFSKRVIFTGYFCTSLVIFLKKKKSN